MPLVDLSMVEQRYDAVREVLDGATVKDTAIRYGVDRRTLHRWLVRYANEGLTALADKSSKPDRCPHQTPPEIEARIVELRRSHPGWGPRTILNKPRRELETPPSRAAIYRCLVRHRLIQPKPRRRRRDDYKRWERSRSMELWQIDVMGSVFLASGIGVSVVTGIDDHSRFCVIAKVVARATARPVCDAPRSTQHLRRPRADPHRQRKGVHRQDRQEARQRAVRPHLPQQRDPPPPHRALFADDDRQDRAPPQDDAQGVLLGQGLRDDRGDAGWSGHLGGRITTTNASIRVSATCRRSGASSWPDRHRSRSSTAMSPTRNLHRLAPRW